MRDPIHREHQFSRRVWKTGVGKVGHHEVGGVDILQLEKMRKGITPENKKIGLPKFRLPRLQQNIARGLPSCLPPCFTANLTKIRSLISPTQSNGNLRSSSQTGLGPLFFVMLVLEEQVRGQGSVVVTNSFKYEHSVRSLSGPFESHGA